MQTTFLHLFCGGVPLLRKTLSVATVLAGIFGATIGLAQIHPDSLDVKRLNAEALARQIVNPTTPLGRVTLGGKRWLLPGSQTNASRRYYHSVAFETSLPFSTGPGASIRLRPNIPVYFGYPVVETSQPTGYRTGLGDISFDLAYGKKNLAGFLYAFGMAATVPTATLDELGGKRFTLGPEMLLAINTKLGFFGIFPNHEWKIAGDGAYSRTNIQPLITLLPGGGWSVGAGPNPSYDWISKEWTVPWSMNIGKTSKFDTSNWTFAADINYFGAQNRPGPEWAIGLSVTRVTTNWLLAVFR